MRMAVKTMQELPIPEFAKLAGVSKQTIYKQVHNKNSQLAPYVISRGNKTFVQSKALKEIYQVDLPNQLDSSQNESSSSQKSAENDQESQLIAFLKAEIDSLKAENQQLRETIQEKDKMIEHLSDLLTDLAGQTVGLAQKALTTTSQQQYLTASQQQYMTSKEKTFHVPEVSSDERQKQYNPKVIIEPKYKHTSTRRSFWDILLK